MQTAMQSKTLVMAAALCAGVVQPVPGHSGQFASFSPTENALVMEGGETRAQLNPGGCDAGHEMACTAVLQRSEFVSTRSHGPGDKVTYSWEIMVPSDFTYNASGGYLRAVRLLDGSGESVFSFILDGDNGYEAGRKTCFGADGFGVWHSIELQVDWDATKRKGLKDRTAGDLRLFCDGTEVLSRTGRPNIGAEEQVRFSFGLAGALKLSDGDKAEVRFRNVSIESRQNSLAAGTDAPDMTAAE